MERLSILVVEHEEAIRALLRNLLTGEGYHVTVATCGEEALRLAGANAIDLFLTDLRLPDIDGLVLLERMLRAHPSLAGIVMTGYGTIDQAVRAIRIGAHEFLTKPFDLAHLLSVVRKVADAVTARKGSQPARPAGREPHRFGKLVGSSPQMQAVVEFIGKVAESDSTVLIQGESGTGKEVVAKMLHAASRRKNRPLIPVNCGAIPENLLESELFGHEKGAFTGAAHMRIGRFELAHGGTIFLDEIGELSPALQVKLLRVLQEREFERVGGAKTINVDVRIVAATNQDLEAAVRDKRFRQDLYYRLNVIPMTLPPLRDRRGDIPELVAHFVDLFNASKQTAIDGCTLDAMAVLVDYAWPGNIRELENMIERLTVLKKRGYLDVSDLPERLLQRAALPEPDGEQFIRINGQGLNLTREIERFENRLIVEALRQANGITSKAAQLLQLNRTTLVEKLKRKGFSPKAHTVGV
ncbi:MAG TPA: sigma-54 dependent transcriptional regulator [Nitrospira sp.]|nr:sigma-54 dependent transcriptional regulator [Nitrospira sp.]